MVYAEESVTIQTSCESVFATLTDLPRMTQWRSNLASAAWADGVEPGAGPDRIHATTQLLGVRLQWLCDVTAWDPPNRFGYTARNRRYTVDVDFRCEPEPSGCRLTMAGGGELPGGNIGALAAPLYVKALIRENRTSLRKLKALVEAEAKGAQA